MRFVLMGFKMYIGHYRIAAYGTLEEAEAARVKQSPEVGATIWDSHLPFEASWAYRIMLDQ